MVDDTVTGVDVRSNTALHGGGRSRCVHRCNERYKACKKAEDARHKQALRACKKNWQCKKAENNLHKSKVKDCIREMQLCKKNCRYREGAGSAGR
jgi:hypothetical protein